MTSSPRPRTLRRSNQRSRHGCYGCPRTEEYDGQPAALDAVDWRRLDAAFDFIGHKGSPTFRRRLAGAYDRAAVADTTISERGGVMLVLNAMTLTLAEKVYNTVAAERATGTKGAMEGAHTFPHTPPDSSLTSFELDCLDWGLVYGIAYGIARGEEPYELDTSVTDRALEAARAAYAKWAGSAIFTNEAFELDRRERPDAP